MAKRKSKGHKSHQSGLKRGLKAQQKNLDSMYKATPAQKKMMGSLWSVGKKKMRSLLD